MADQTLHRQNIVACIWDFDKTLINGYMESPLFRRFEIDEPVFWEEVNALPALYKNQGIRVSPDTVYLNHILTYARRGYFPGLNNALLRQLGSELSFFPGLPSFFQELKEVVRSQPEFVRHNILLEHYIVSTGLAEMIRGSGIAPFVEEIYGCEFIEHPFSPGFMSKKELGLDTEPEICQIGTMVDNTIKTRFIFEINKGTNKNPDIDVNAMIAPEDRRVPIPHMLYTADGPSDVPVFSVVKRYGGTTFAVYNPRNTEEFAQNDRLLQMGRIHAYGPADYKNQSSTHLWIRMHVLQICERIVNERELALARKVSGPPVHLHGEDETAEAPAPGPEQAEFFDPTDEG